LGGKVKLFLEVQNEKNWNRNVLNKTLRFTTNFSLNNSVFSNLHEMIRTAKTSEHELLTKIAFLAKKTWNYPNEYMKVWKDELTITPVYISENIVFVFEEENHVKGFISLAKNNEERMVGNNYIEKGYWMDHLFIHPKFQNLGIGKQLMFYLQNYCKKNGIASLLVFVDPFAVGFYKKLGALFVRISASSIPGRELPVYKIITSL